MPAGTHWTPQELLVAFRLYCRTPFGKLHQHNPEIIELSRKLGRTPSALGMKACNFASLDPTQQARNITALGNVSRADRELWAAFHEDSQTIAAAAEAAFRRLMEQDTTSQTSDIDFDLPEGPTEITRTTQVRRIQSFFRSAVLTSYGYRCALSGIALPELLNASHIIPWKANPARRADPRNGIALNALYDRAFDRGLMTFDDSLRVVLSNRLKIGDLPILHRQAFLELEGKPLHLPGRFSPDPVAMAYHREHVFSPT
jgi:predicted restriction endonuclease